MSAGQAILLIATLLVFLGIYALVRRSYEARDLYDTLTTDETAHEVLDPSTLEFLPDGFTCQGCFETDALPGRVWCAVCSERVADFPAEPIDRGALEACISRHPAGKQRKAGER